MPDNDDLKVSAKAEKVEDDKTRRQQAEAEAIKQRMSAVDRKADQARTAATASAARTSSANKDSGLDAGQLATAGVSLAAGLLAGKDKKKGGFLTGLIVGLVVGALLMGLMSTTGLLGKVLGTKEGADAVLDENLLGYTAADFQDAVLGAASEHQELVVMEQPLEITTTLTKSGLGGLAIFSKVKTVTYHGTGVYTVDMKNIDKEHVKVDTAAKTVTVVIPHAALQYVNPDLDKTEFEDTEKGLLAFGDLALTTEQHNTLAKAVEDAMRQRLTQKDLYEQADEYATMKTWEIFQPLVTAVSPQFKVVMQFAD